MLEGQTKVSEDGLTSESDVRGQKGLTDIRKDGETSEIMDSHQKG